MNILDYYPDLTPSQASKANLAASTFAGLTFLSVYFFFFDSSPILITALLLLGMVVDSATVPYVHKGNISKRYKNMAYADKFFKLHVPTAIIAYGSMMLFIVTMFVNRVDLLFYVFLAAWHIVYFTGFYAYTQVTDAFIRIKR